MGVFLLHGDSLGNVLIAAATKLSRLMLIWPVAPALIMGVVLLHGDSLGNVLIAAATKLSRLMLIMTPDFMNNVRSRFLHLQLLRNGHRCR